MDLGLSGKRVLITGGSGGIGVAIARELAAEGARRTINFLGDRTHAEGLARVVAVFVSNTASYVTGTSVFIDGGTTTYPSFAHGG